LIPTARQTDVAAVPLPDIGKVASPGRRRVLVYSDDIAISHHSTELKVIYTVIYYTIYGTLGSRKAAIKRALFITGNYSVTAFDSRNVHASL